MEFFIISALLVFIAICAFFGVSILLLIYLNIKIIMAAKQAFLDVIQVIADAATNIEADVNALLQRIAEGGMSDLEEQEVLDVLNAVAVRAKAISDIVPDPAPEEPTDGEG